MGAMPEPIPGIRKQIVAIPAKIAVIALMVRMTIDGNEFLQNRLLFGSLFRAHGSVMRYANLCLASVKGRVGDAGSLVLFSRKKTGGRPVWFSARLIFSELGLISEGGGSPIAGRQDRGFIFAHGPRGAVGGVLGVFALQ